MGAINTVDVKWTGNLAFEGTSGSGHTVALDGERTAGASPMEFLLMGLGGCSSIDVVMILKRMREDITDVQAHIEGERAEEDPKVYTRIHVHFVVTGKNLKDANVARAIELSATKYCSASVMLGQVAKITHDYEIIEG